MSRSNFNNKNNEKSILHNSLMQLVMLIILSLQVLTCNDNTDFGLGCNLNINGNE